MSKTELVEKQSYTPKRVATDLIGTIKSIEEAIETSGNAIEEVKGRGFFKKVFSSSNQDLVTISQSQNKVNELMLGVIQEIITLNVMSYSYLAGVMLEFEKMFKHGWKDNEGCLQKLSQNGETFANTTSNIFKKILDGSKATQQKIELNGTRIEELRTSLKQKDALDEQQSQSIVTLRNTLHEKDAVDEQQSQQIGRLAKTLEEKGRLDYEQSQSIVTLRSTLHEKDAVDEQQSQQIGRLAKTLDEKGNLDNEQSRQLEEVRRLLEDQKAIGGQNSQRLIELFKDLQRKEQQGKARDAAIAVINEVVEGLQQNINRLEGRCKSLTLVSVGLGAVVTALVAGLSLFVF